MFALGDNQRGDRATRSRSPKRSSRRPGADLARLPAPLAAPGQPDGRPGSAATASATRCSVGVGPGPRRALPLQRHRVPRGHDRRVQGARRALQRQLPLRRRGAASTSCSDAKARAHRLPRQLRADRWRACCRELPRRWRCCCRSTTAAASRCCPARSTTRRRWPRVSEAPPPVTPIDGRPLHPLHRRHDRHAEGRAVAAARHLLRRHGRPAARRRRDGREPGRAGRARAERRADAHAAGAAVHARRGALVGVHHAAPGRDGRACRTTPARLDADDIWRTVERERVILARHRRRRVRAAADRSAASAAATTSRACRSSARAAPSCRRR